MHIYICKAAVTEKAAGRAALIFSVQREEIVIPCIGVGHDTIFEITEKINNVVRICTFNFPCLGNGRSVL